MGIKLHGKFLLLLLFLPALIWGQCPGSVSISASPGNNICADTSVTFTATANGGTGTFSYQWQIDGVDQGAATTDNTFTSSTLANGERVRVIVTSSDDATCSTNSSQITMTVNQNKTPTVAFSASPSLKCVGSSVTFTASNTNGGTNPNYEWFVDGTSVQSSSSSTYSTTTLSPGDHDISVELTSTLACVTSANASTTSTITITDDATINSPSNKDQTNVCINTGIDPIVFTISGSGNNATVSGLPTGVSGNYSSGNFTISGSPSIAGTFPYTVTASGPCDSATESGTITVLEDATISLTSGNNDQEVCQDEVITNIIYDIGETGTGATVTGLPTGISGNFSGGVYTISGSSSVTGTHNFTINATGTCGDSGNLTGSIIINENLSPSVSISSSDTDNIICEGTEVTFTATPTNGGSSPSYQWKVGTSNVGSDSNTFITNSLAVGDQSVSVIITSNETCLAQPTATSNSIVTTVNPNLTPDVTITASDSDICDGDSITFTATPTNGGTAPSYQWKLDGTNVGTNSPTYTTTNLSAGQNVTVVLTSNETCLATTTATSDPVSVTVNPNLTPEVSIVSNDTNNIICSGSSITFTATPVNGGASPTYQWYVDGSPAGSGGASFTTSSLTNGQTVKVIMTSDEECLATATAESNEINIQVDDSLSAITPSFDNTNPAHNPTAICPVAPGLVYRVNPIPGATSYLWTFPNTGGWTVTNGVNTNEITVTAQANANSGNITVVGVNECGNSQPVSMEVTTGTVAYVNAGPDQTVCMGTSSITLAGEIGGVIKKNQDWDWSASISGGSFSNPNKLDSDYIIPANIRDNGGTVTITITSVSPSGQCPDPKVDEMLITVLSDAVISNPAEKDQTVCIDNPIADILFNITDAGTGANVTGLPAGLIGNYNAGVFTISGTPTESGSFDYTVNTTGNCSSQQTSQTGNITVNPDQTISDPANKDQEICINNAITDIIFSTNLTVTNASVSGLPAGLIGNFTTGNFTISGTASEAGTFNYTVTTNGDCLNTTQDGIITVLPDPIIDSPTNKNQEICINTAIADIPFNITSPGTDATVTGLPSGISGSFNNGIYTLTGTPSEDGVFDYTVTTISACNNVSQTGQIIVNPDPTAAISYDGEFCTSQSGTVAVTLTGTGAFENGDFYSSPAGLSLDSTTGEITPGTSSPSTYTVSYDTTSGCVTFTAQTTVTINELPFVEISYEDPFCTSDGTAQTVTFTNGIGAYENGTFSSTPGGLDIDANTGEISPQTSSPNSNPYTVYYTIPATSGCNEVIVETQVTITQLPQVSISYDAPFCTSDNTVYSVNYSSTAGDYTGGSFYGTEGLDIDANSGDINPSGSTPGTHTITYSKDTNDDGCPVVETTTDIQIYEQVLITTQPENFGTCSSNPASFEVVATPSDVTYQWYKKDVNGNFVQINGETSSILSFSNVTYDANHGEYHVVVSSTNPVCTSVTSDPVTLNIDEDIEITKPAEDVTICEDDYESLSFEYEAHANGAPLNFQWIKDGNPINPNSGKYSMNATGPTGTEGVYTGTLTIENINTNDDGVYWVEIDGPDYFTCAAATSKTFTFRVNPRPAPPVTSDIVYCLNDPAVELTATKDSSDNELLWYSYDSTTTEFTYLGTSITPLTDAVGETSYWVSQRQPNGCESDPAELKVIINDKPGPLATETIEFNYCFNQTVTDPISITPDAGSTINWYDSENAATPLGSAPIPNTGTVQITSYWASQTLNSTGCESDRTKVDIIINPLPEIQINIIDGFSSDICIGTETRLMATGATTYKWYFEGAEIGTGNEITITGDNSGSFNYEVTGTDDLGCVNTDVITINVEEPSDGGITTGPASVCVTQNAGTITLADYLGEILRWESSTDGINWTTISETSDTLAFQDIPGPTSFRAIVKNGVCGEEASTETSVSVDQEPQAGGVLFRGTDRVFMMCEFPTEDYLVPLQYTGPLVGEIVAWQYRRNSQSGWTNIQENGENFTGNSLTGAQVNTAAMNESTLFRVEVQSGACEPNVYSDYATLSIIPSDIAPSPVQITPGEVCLGEIVTLSSSTGYGGSGTFQGGAFDNSSIANHGWRVMRFGSSDYTEYTFESAADNTRPERWMRTNPHDYQMNDPNDPGSIIWQRFDSCSCDEGNKGFAIVSGNNPSTLETPVFNLYTMDNPTLTFDQAYNLTSDDLIRVELSMDGGNTYNIVLMEIQGPVVSGNYALFGDDHLGPPNNMEIDLSPYAGLSNLRVRWLYDGTTGGIYTIDDIGLPEDPQNVQLIWYYDDDINDPNNNLEQIGEINQSTVTYPQDGAQWPKIGWNDFEVQTALVFDTNGDPCESAENSAVASVYVFDNYTSTAISQVGACGETDVQLSATITGVFQGDITEFPEGEGSTVAWEVIEAPAGYNFSEDHFVNTDDNLAAINDPQAIFQPTVEGNYTLRFAITPNESQTTRDIQGTMVTQDISANPCPMTHFDTSFEYIDCTTLDFDGDDDYIDLGNNYNGNYFIEAWIRPFDRPIDSGGTTEASTGVIFSSSGMEIRMEDLNGVSKNGRWHHIAVANNGDLWVDGVASGNIDISGSGINNTSIGARFNASTKTTSNHFSGWIEELRIWNTQPTEKQIRFMMNQRLKLDATGTVVSPLQGEVVPNLVIADGGLSSYHTNGTYNLDQDDTPFYNLTINDLAGYYRLYSDIPDPANLIPGYFDPALEPSGGNTPDHAVNKVPGRLYNITTDQENTSPTPYFSKQGGNWEDINTWARPAVWDHPNSTSGGSPIDWNIARINHNISSGDKHITMLGLLSETVDKELTIESIPDDHFIRISHYLLLHGNMDLEGESQLLQDHGSILDNTSAGWAQIDQQGRMSSFNYNYLTSPVSNQGANNNSGFILNQVMYDGTNPASPQPINWSNGYFSADGAKTSPITISNEWIWDFRGGNADIYGDWLHLGSDYTEIVGAGFSMKGTDGTVAPNTQQQNYIFEGKPNNGNIPTTELYLQNNQNYLVGNPYPSAIDAEEFLRDNLVNVGTGSGNNQNNQNVFNGTLYYWDHFAGSTHILEEYIGGYATYTLSGSAPAISNDWRINSGGGSNNIVPERYIPVAQGFFLNSAPVAGQNFAGDIIFDNTQRIYKRESVDPSIFLQQEDDIVKGEQQTSNQDQRMKIRLKFESPKGYHRQILVTRDENTSNGFDVGYDAPLIENNIEDMYWWFEENRFVIQGVPDFEKEQILPLAVKTNAGGEFKIRIDETENWPSEKELYLKDKLTDSIHDILKQAYVGNTEVTGEITDRFELVFFKEQAQDPVIPDPDPDDVIDPNLPIIDDLVGISYSTFSKQVKISNFDLLKVDKVMIFDMGGKLIQEFDELPTEEEILLGMRPVRSGVYIVKVFCETGICNKKIIVK
ncbi:T9SS type A sorting domain-containing protein [Christiangramia sabulilitoris]|uniref:T9SS type A sorting domain-containing protein n=1 Tax=Christiangramia sabulilitoris TaxID=2583991 RepID=A0A550HZB0_9FLAO|nr:T9SS type A sorting domain-containing protein [Christiangramia sabulilitoris]TRO64045.1 T9SS type A sorting domain-containing protein [Christiangramia sabulilitoris]